VGESGAGGLACRERLPGTDLYVSPTLSRRQIENRIGARGEEEARGFFFSPSEACGEGGLRGGTEFPLRRIRGVAGENGWGWAKRSDVSRVGSAGLDRGAR